VTFRTSVLCTDLLPRRGVHHRTMKTHVVTRVALAAAVIAGLAGVSAEHADAVSPERGGHQLVENGSGEWRDFPCILPRTGRCQFNLLGTLSGAPVENGRYAITINDDGAATPDSCLPVTFAGLFGDNVPDQNIGITGDGQLCPDGAGGFTFEGPFRITGGGGRFRRIRGSGTFEATIGADRTSTVSMTGRQKGVR
jgi:hypothetical protein